MTFHLAKLALAGILVATALISAAAQARDVPVQKGTSATPSAPLKDVAVRPIALVFG